MNSMAQARLGHGVGSEGGPDRIGRSKRQPRWARSPGSRPFRQVHRPELGVGLQEEAASLAGGEVPTRGYVGRDPMISWIIPG